MKSQLPLLQTQRELPIVEIAQAGNLELHYRFERGFRKYITQRQNFLQRLDQITPVQNQFKPIIKSALDALGDESGQCATNFNRYEGFLERASNAAQALKGEYDVGVGIARKGFWLSYLFHLNGLPTHDVYVARTGGNNRTMLMVSPLMTEHLRNKRVLLFDNDLHTGRSLEVTAQELSKASPASIDALLIYRDSQIHQSKFEEVASAMPHQPLVRGITGEDEIIFDTTMNMPRNIKRWKTLQCDFSPQADLSTLANILGVNADVTGGNYQVLSLDLDGTLIERDFDYHLWGVPPYHPSQGILWQKMGQKLEVDPTQLYEHSLRELDNVPCGDIAIKSWLRYYNLSSYLTEEEIVAAVPGKIETFSDYHPLIELARQQKKRIIIVTESSGAMLERKLRETGIDKDVDAVYSIPELTGTGKTIESYGVVLKRENIKPCQVLHIGDSSSKDYISPRAQGIHAYYLNREQKRGGEAPARHVIHSLQEVHRLL